MASKMLSITIHFMEVDPTNMDIEALLKKRLLKIKELF